MSFSYVPGKNVEVPDIPFKDNVVLPADDTAVLVIDMQNDFVQESGSLTIPPAKDTIANIQRVLDMARNTGVKVAYTQDTAVKGDPEFDIWPEHCVKGTWGWEIVDELKPRPEELVCLKNRYDGFYGSWLDHFLTRIYKVGHLVIVGTAANICVLHTAASAGLRWFHIVIPADGISALTEFDQALTLRQVSALYNGEVVKSVEHIQFRS